MAELDRLAWKAGLPFECYGLRLGVRVTDAGVMDDVLERLPIGWRPSEEPIVDQLYSLVVGGHRQGRVQRLHLLYSGSYRLGRGRRLEPLLVGLAAHLRLVVAARSPERVFLHAGVVAVGGRAILLPGQTMAGKSTLVAELVRRGAVYYSDEFAVLDAEGRVHPFPKPITLRTDDRGGSRELAPEELAGRTGEAPLPVEAVFVTRFEEGRRFRPRRISRAAALLDLLEATALTRRDPARALSTLAAALEGATVWKGPRGEAAKAARSILARVGRT